MRICIVVPVYNEEAGIESNLEQIIAYARQLPASTTVLAVNDGSQDKTESILNTLKERYAGDIFRLISYKINKGYGGAVREGMRFAIENNYDYAIFMDSDLTNHPKYLQKFYEKMAQGYDYIKATRYAKGGNTIGVPWQHKILSAMGNRLARILYGLPLTDFTNGFRAVKTDILRKITTEETSFSIIMEELYRVKDIARTFCEIPYVLTSRTENQRKSKFSYGLKTYFRYLKYPLKTFLRRK